MAHKEICLKNLLKYSDLVYQDLDYYKRLKLKKSLRHVAQQTLMYQRDVLSFASDERKSKREQILREIDKQNEKKRQRKYEDESIEM